MFYFGRLKLDASEPFLDAKVKLDLALSVRPSIDFH